MLDRTLIGKKYSPTIFSITDQRIRFFAKATGQTDPIYFDQESAVKQGYKGIVCPPTFLIIVGMEQEPPYQYIEDLNVRIERILHAEQEFSYGELVFEGDTLKMETEIIDMYDKKDGLLQFCVLESRFINQNSNHVGTMKHTIVVR